MKGDNVAQLIDKVTRVDEADRREFRDDPLLADTNVIE
jgi:hypothetical protein